MDQTPKEKEKQPRLNVREIGVIKSSYFEDSQVAPYNPALLYQRKSSYSLFEEVRRDDTVDSLLEYKKSLILGGSYYVDSKDEKVRDFWKQALSRDYEGNFSEALKEMLTAIDFGFSTTELVFKPITFQGSQYWGIKYLKTRPPQTIEIHTDKHGNIEKIMQHADTEELTLDPNNFILYTHRKEFDNHYGKADITEGVYRAVFSKKMIVKFMNIALERFSMPFVVGTVPETDDDNDREEFFNMLKNLSAKAAMTKSEKYKVEYLESSRQLTDIFIGALQYNDLKIARALLIADLMGMSGAQMSSGGLGGDLGGVQFEVMLAIFKKYRSQLCEVINNRIILPLTKLNFGEEAEAELKLNDLTKDEKYRAMGKFIEYVKIPGIKITDEQIKWLMEIIGAPVGEQQEGEEPEKKPEDAPEDNPEDAPEDPDNPANPEDTPDKPENPDKPEDTPDNPDVPGGKPKETKHKHTAFTPWRELTKCEQKINFSQRDKEIEDTVANHTKKINAVITDMVAGLYATLRDKKIIERKRFDLIHDLTIPGQSKLNAVFSEMLTDSMNQGKTAVKEEEGNSKKFQITFDPDIDLATSEIIQQWKKSRIVYLTKTIDRDIRDVLEPQLADAMRTGITLREVTKEISKALTSALSEDRIEMIARTNIMAAYNQGRIQAFKKVPDMRGVQWSAILDTNVCDTCASFDKKILRMSEINDYPLPAHPNCRCIQVSVHSDEIEGEKESDIYDKLPAVDKKNGFMGLAKRKGEEQ